MLVEDAYSLVIRSYPGEVGRFYFPGTLLALGKGEILKDAIFAMFDEQRKTYRMAEGIAYVLTHECDVEEANQRIYNDDLLVCPLIPLEVVVEELEAELTEEQLTSFLSNLGARNVSRLIYFPPVRECFPFGAVMFLNRITNAPVGVLRTRSSLICALTGFGLTEVESALHNHLLRPKSERLALMPANDD